MDTSPSIQFNKIIKKKSTGKEKEKELLDELINQIELEDSKQVEESKPIEITEQVRSRMVQLMDSYLANKEKLGKVNEIRKQLTVQSSGHMKDLETLMKLYGLNELIKGNNKFVLDRVTRKKPLKKNEFKEVITYVLGNPETVEKIYTTAGQMSEETVVEKLKCLKYNGGNPR
jgi:hypothetical protein